MCDSTASTQRRSCPTLARSTCLGTLPLRKPGDLDGAGEIVGGVLDRVLELVGRDVDREADAVPAELLHLGHSGFKQTACPPLSTRPHRRAMRARGVEPPRAEAHRDLNPARLPVPPRPRTLRASAAVVVVRGAAAGRATITARAGVPRLPYRVDDQTGERDERERREGDERLVRLEDEQRAERADDDTGGRDRPAGPRSPARARRGTRDRRRRFRLPLPERRTRSGRTGPRYAASNADLVRTWATSASTTVGSNSMPEQRSNSATAEALETAGAPDRPSDEHARCYTNGPGRSRTSARRFEVCRSIR